MDDISILSWADSGNGAHQPGTTKIWSPGTNIVGFGKDSAAPHTLQIYNTYTDASNYELGWVGWDGNTFRIGPIASGTGTIRPVIIRLGSQIHTFTTAGNVEFAKYIQVADGSGIAPSITGNTSTTSGWAFIGGEINYVRAGSPMFRFSFEETRHTLNGKYNWSGTASANGTPDTGLARYSAGVVEVTDGSTGLGTLYAAGIGRPSGAVLINSTTVQGATIYGNTRIQGGNLNFNGRTFIVEDGAADIVALRNSTNAQTFNIYNTYTDASNYERASFNWTGNTFYLTSEAAGTGTRRDFWIRPNYQVAFSPAGGGAQVYQRPAAGIGSEFFSNVSFHIKSGNNSYIKLSPSGALTSNLSPLIVEAEYNNAATTFEGIVYDLTDTASGASSSLMRLKQNGAVRFDIRKDGRTTISGDYTLVQRLWINNNNGFIGFGSASAGDVRIYREGAGILAQLVPGSNPQTFRIYNTYTDGSNYERGFLKWDSNFLKIGTEAAGTGSNRSLWLTPASGQVFVPAGSGTTSISSYGNGTRILADNGLYLNGYNGGLYLQTSSGTITRTKIEASPGSITLSSTDDYGIQLAQTLNATVANPGAEYRALKINVTETDTTGWDDVYLFDAQVGGVSKTYIENDGDIRTFGVFGLDASGVASYYVRTGAIQHYQGLFAGGTTGALGLTNGADWAVRSTGAFGWSSTTTAYSAVDLKLYRDAAYTLAQRFGTNPQTFNIYNTYTDASNYERGFLKWDTNVLVLGTEASGTGTTRHVHLNNVRAFKSPSTGSTIFYGQGTASLELSYRNLSPYGDNQTDLGGTTKRFKDFYLIGGIYAGTGFGTAGQVLTSNGTTVSWQDSAGEFTALTDTPANYTGHAGKLVRVNSAATELEFTDQIDLDEIVFDATIAPANGTIVADTFPMYLTATGTSPNRELALKVKTQDDQEIIIASVLV